MTKVVVSGADGRMGQAVCEAVEGAEDMELLARADPALEVELAAVLDGADVVVDFTTPETALANVAACLGAGVHAVVGTTGFDQDELRRLAEEAPGEANCFVAPNFAIGAVLLMEAAQRIAPHMPDCEIIELHHDGKLDAPSGTAKRTAELIGRRAATSTSRSTRCGYPGWSLTRRSCSGASDRRSACGTTRSIAAPSCPGCCSRSAASAGWRIGSPSGSRSFCSGTVRCCPCLILTASSRPWPRPSRSPAPSMSRQRAGSPPSWSRTARTGSSSPGRPARPRRSTTPSTISLLRAVVEEIGGEATVICGTGTNDTRHSVELTKAAAEAGADAALVVTPYYNKPNRAGIRAHFEAIAAAVPELPILAVQHPLAGRRQRPDPSCSPSWPRSTTSSPSSRPTTTSWG